MLPKTSSLVISPVISARFVIEFLISTDNKSPEIFSSRPLLTSLIALIAFICIQAGWGLKADLGGDATQNFLSSYNFYSSFEYGHHIGQAGFRREPLPNWTLAVFLWLFFRPTTGLDRDEVLANIDILDAAVCVNIFWALFLSFVNNLYL